MDTELKTWHVWSVDCWGNAEEGYEMNDRSRVCTVELSSDPTDRQVMQALKDCGELNKHAQLRHLSIDGSDGSLYVDQAKDGYMLWQLSIED